MTVATKTDLLRQVQQLLGPRCVGVFYPMTQHVPREDVIAAAAQAREAKPDVLVSLGGGSPVDGTKAVSLCLAEGVVKAADLDAYRVRGPRGMRFNPQRAFPLFQSLGAPRPARDPASVSIPNGLFLSFRAARFLLAQVALAQVSIPNGLFLSF
ncbi:MAG: iron-containing alcohol dehydrogenase, partial [Anaerolineae bacterium]|nr:iron-containing alcohol dehydrogenase [Anaerolineae bacterium]